MNLRTGTFLWPSTLPEARTYPSLDKDADCEVLVIGGGESGSLVSYQLNEQGVDTILVDKRPVAHGTCSANTGLLQMSNDKPLTACMHTFGQEFGARFYALCRQAVDDLEAIAAKLVYSPEFRRRPSLYYASCPDDVPQLRDEYEALRGIGFPVEFWDRDRIARHFSFEKPGAIYTQGDAEVNPFKLVNALIHTAHDRGLRVYTNTEITDCRVQYDRVVFQAGRHRIRAKYAVYATGYEAQEERRHPNAVMSSSFAIATKPLPAFPGWHERCLLWETARPYLFIRTTADHRIVVGGFDEGTVSPEEREIMLPHKREVLLEALRRLFPAIPDLEAEYAWTAAFGSTHDGLPMFGERPGYPQCFFLLGYGGNGTIYSMIGSKLVADRIVHGRSSPDLELFRLDRAAHARPTVRRPVRSS